MFTGVCHSPQIIPIRITAFRFPILSFSPGYRKPLQPASSPSAKNMFIKEAPIAVSMMRSMYATGFCVIEFKVARVKEEGKMRKNITQPEMVSAVGMGKGMDTVETVHAELLAGNKNGT